MFTTDYTDILSYTAFEQNLSYSVDYISYITSLSSVKNPC